MQGQSSAWCRSCGPSADTLSESGYCRTCASEFEGYTDGRRAMALEQLDQSLTELLRAAPVERVRSLVDYRLAGGDLVGLAV